MSSNDGASQSNKDSRNNMSAQSSKNEETADVYKGKRPTNINTI